MSIKNFEAYKGQHCETTATGTLLSQIGINLSEPMLFGIGEGLGYIYWDMKSMSFPFIGGRIKTDLLSQNIAKHLNLKLQVNETASSAKAWQNVKSLLDQGKVVGLKLDCYYLEFFSNPFHFAGHYAAIYDYDDQYAYLVDTQQQGGLVKTSLQSLAMARAAKGPMASKNLSYTLETKDQAYDLSLAIKNAIINNAQAYLQPPITNISYKGIIKTSSQIIKWFENSKDIENEFKSAANLMEKAGTGGALFRNLYRDFLKESYPLLPLVQIQSAYNSFSTIAKLWSSVASLFLLTSETQNIKYINEASKILLDSADKEKQAMETLLSIQ